MQFSDEAVVLSLGRFREADVWLRLLSPSRGLFTAFAFGGSKSRKRFCGCLDSLNRLSVSVDCSGRGNYLCLREATLLSGPIRLRKDSRRLGQVMNSLKFLEAFGVAVEGALEAFSLLKDLLCLSEGDESLPELLPLFFRLRLAFDHGYALDLNNCARCDKPLLAKANSKPQTNQSSDEALTSCAILSQESCFLLADQGQMLCSNCATTLPSRSGPLLRLGQKSVEVLRYVASRPLSSWGELELSTQTTVRREIARAIDAFVEYHVGLRWDNGRFVRC